ncbi:transcription initiation factor IIF [Lentithecium fluviatile CBS 122367]|uniref:Transcription initiation factor IIF subunit beta n=1 Tax=Lentithecium fluviatile CBS 122367 TaxID=1168545 RepID=A0A6G1IN13_9PLEO|nr:transcription initiation factor IIF [Lentithecium fluviatile CBS 122367]
MNGIKADPDVKMEHDAVTPSGSGYMDDDFYEDTGELQLPLKGAERDIWLTRIPDWLYEKISNWDELAEGNDDDQVVLGEVLAFPDSMEKDGISKKHPMRLFFDERWRHKSQLPTAFELEPQSTKGEMLKNTYIFTEKDLPGYKHNGVGQNRYGAPGGYGGYGIQDPKARIQKRTKYKKAIPKQTTLLGSATRQYLAQPLSTREFIAFDAARHKQAIQGANLHTNIVDHINELNEMGNAQNSFNSFIRPAVPRKSQLNKAARIPRNELIDQLHKCFDKYAYWPMKSLKQETKQPEAYLKEVLGDIAMLVKSGPFASCWARSGNYGNAIAERPPDADTLDSGDEEDEMEDVV